MSIEDKCKSLYEKIFEEDHCIAIFVVNEAYFYFVDSKDNYCIDARPEYEVYVESGFMEASLLEESVSSFRDGFPALNKSNILTYLESNEDKLYTRDQMKLFFIYNKKLSELKETYSAIENYLSSPSGDIPLEWDDIKIKLPCFYIDFDRKVFRHTDWDRLHECLVPSDWDAEASADFGLWIPDYYQYWVVENMNFWNLNR